MQIAESLTLSKWTVLKYFLERQAEESPCPIFITKTKQHLLAALQYCAISGNGSCGWISIVQQQQIGPYSAKQGKLKTESSHCLSSYGRGCYCRWFQASTPATMTALSQQPHPWTLARGQLACDAALANCSCLCLCSLVMQAMA